MTSAQKNPILALFASVRLALFLLFFLAATSIIGTLIPQNQPYAQYVQQYGAKTARFFHLLDIPDMYSSWWFLGLLTLFALNLLVCSLDRIPQVIRLVRKDGLTINPEHLEKFPLHQARSKALPVAEGAALVASLLRSQGWRARTKATTAGQLFFAQQGVWTRFGVYVVHCSILIILVGALVGSPAVARRILHNPLFAFKGMVMIPEAGTTDHITAIKTGEQLPLGFTVTCDAFAIEYYPTGMPKTYRSRVTIREAGTPVRTADIEVNRPLTHRGVTFYQSSYQPYQEYIVSLKQRKTGLEKKEIIVPAKEITWREAGVTYGLINRESQGEATKRLKVWFSDQQGDPSLFWVPIGQEAVIERPSGTYLLTVRQMYATGLQATRDPGVWLVYGGCLLMLIGLSIAFFLSHRKIYALVTTEGTGCRLLFAGEANKNKVGFETKFSELINRLEKQ